MLLRSFKKRNRIQREREKEEGETKRRRDKKKKGQKLQKVRERYPIDDGNLLKVIGLLPSKKHRQKMEVTPPKNGGKVYVL